MKFELGQLAATCGVAALMEENKEFATFVQMSFLRFNNCNWGEMDEADKEANDEAVAAGDLRIFASYIHPKRPEWKIWIITESDRSATTILFPSEY